MDISKLNFPKLSGSNYGLWKVNLAMALTLMSLYYTVTDNLPADPVALAKYQEDSLKAVAAMALTCADHLKPVVARQVSAKVAWDYLASIYAPRSAGRDILIQRQFDDLRMLPTEAIDVYLGRAQELYADMQTNGMPTTEHHIVSKLIAGLPPRFDTLVCYYQQSEAPLTFAHVSTKLIHHELYLAARQTTTIETAAFTSKVNTSSDNNRHDSGRQSQTSVSRSYNSGNNTSTKSNYDRNKTCNFCHRRGHAESDCRTKQRQQGNPSTNTTSTPQTHTHETPPHARTRQPGARPRVVHGLPVLRLCAHRDQGARDAAGRAA